MNNELVLNCGSFEELSENDVMQITGGGTFSWVSFGGSVLGGAVTGGLAGVAIGGIGGVPGAIGGGCIGGISYCFSVLFS